MVKNKNSQEQAGSLSHRFNLVQACLIRMQKDSR